MKWIKKGHLFSPDNTVWWSKKYALYPTPFYIKEKEIIRVFFGTVDENFYGRTSYIDVNANNPSEIINVAKNYVLDLGTKGTFDDCGATPACAIKVNSKTHLYYAGFCRSHQSPYHIFSGLAVSTDNDNYQRYSNVPVLDRTSKEYFDRAGQTVIYDEGLYKSWYVSGVRWETINSSLYNAKVMPVHTIRYATSKDGIKWVSGEDPCFGFKGEEFGFGRPWVIKEGGLYRMWYSIRDKNLPYKMGYSESKDGITWERKDYEVGIKKSNEGWDSEMVCYGAVIIVNNQTYMFYNGNNQGETGFGLAILE